MKILYPVGVHKVYHDFLKAEWYSDQYKLLREIEPDLFDRFTIGCPEIIRAVLSVTRRTVLKSLPKDTEWFSVAIEPPEFEQFRIICESSWHEVFGELRTVGEVALKVRQSIPDDTYHSQKIKDIESNIGKHSFDEKLIAITSGASDHISFLEGNHRAVAFMLSAMKGNAGSIPEHMFLGISPDMKTCPFY